jgi:hypothetical protein
MRVLDAAETTAPRDVSVPTQRSPLTPARGRQDQTRDPLWVRQLRFDANG